VTKTSMDFNKTYNAENGTQVIGHMWALPDFQHWLVHQNGYDVWNEKLLPEIKQIVIDSIICAQDAIIHRKCSWELFGYDIMVDEDNKAWLIEINSSPACDYSTSVAETYVKKSLSSILDIILDDDTKCDDSNNKDVTAKKGVWEQIYCGKFLSNNASTLNSNNSEHQMPEFDDSDLSDCISEEESHPQKEIEKEGKIKLKRRKPMKQDRQINDCKKEALPMKTVTLDIII